MTEHSFLDLLVDHLVEPVQRDKLEQYMSEMYFHKKGSKAMAEVPVVSDEN